MTDEQAKKLTKKQEVFINEYLVSFNATKAAIAAGYSKKTAYSIGWENLRKLEIQDAIKARLDEVHMSADEAIKRLSDMARGDLGDFLEITTMGHHIDLAKAQELGKTYLLKKVKQKTITVNSKDKDSETFIEEIELHDPQSALRDLLKIAGKYKDGTTVNINMSWKDFVEGKTDDGKSDTE